MKPSSYNHPLYLNDFRIERKNNMILNGRKCIERLDHERNIVLLMYVTATRFIDQLRPHIEMEQSLAMKLMFVLTKKSFIVFQKLKKVVTNKSNEYAFPEEDWNGFINIPEHYEKAKHKIDSEYQICQQNFQKVMSEASKFKDDFSKHVNDDVNDFDEEASDQIIRSSLKIMIKNLIKIKNKIVSG